MPYIKQELREPILDTIEPLLDTIHEPENPGELNFLLTVICQYYFQTHHNYQGINDVLGALEGCKLEFYRRHAALYEDGKIKENGDVDHTRREVEDQPR